MLQLNGSYNYRLRWGSVLYEVALVYKGEEVPYAPFVNTSFVYGYHLAYDSWRWGHRLETLLEATNSTL